MDKIAKLPWWLVLFQGFLITLLGTLMLAWPGLTTVVLLRLLGIYWFISAIFSILSIFADRSDWLWKSISGVTGILAGIAIINHPLLSAILVPATLLILMAILGIAFGIFYVIQVFRGGSWIWGILGAFSILLGVLLFSLPLLSIAAIPLVFGGVSLVVGIAAIYMAFRLRRQALEEL
jgi:uncharacterized membrane protein HdeD (DUF308 family)